MGLGHGAGRSSSQRGARRCCTPTRHRRRCLQALTEAGRIEGEEFQYTEAPIGGAAIDATGDPYPASTEAVCKASDAVLLACIGGCVRVCMEGGRGARAGGRSVHTGRGSWRCACATHPPHAPCSPPPCLTPPSAQLQVGQPAAAAAPRVRPAAPAVEPQRVCKPAPRGGAAAAGRRVHAQARGGREGERCARGACGRVEMREGRGVCAGHGHPCSRAPRSGCCAAWRGARTC